METERLHKILAARGVASRRASEELIAAGRVTVDGEVVRKMGAMVGPDADIRVDGRAVAAPRKVYFMLNKPRGYVTTLRDDRGRKSVGDLIKRLRTRVYPVGRLDEDSEGLLLLTNDGWLTNILTHPRFEIERTYAVKTRGRMADEAIGELRGGVRLTQGRVSAKVSVLKRTRSTTHLMMTIKQGHNRQIRRMCAAVGHPVTRLKRVAFGPLRLRGVSPGSFRALNGEEITAVKRLAEQAALRSSGGGDSAAEQKEANIGGKKRQRR